ncbi:MAG: hypothetical protein Q7J72_01645 [Candidatus Omnitrophota bacterium]|nr:hypothetical protein [Candidatus Omnitrophota bacterium]
MKKYADSITQYLQNELKNSAVSYLKAGLEIFHKTNKAGSWSSQPALGNLGIAVELMLKAFIVKNNPLLLFKGLPIELQVLFTCPDSLPRDFNWRLFDIDLRSFKYETKELNECISAFYVLLPEHKQELNPYMQLLSRYRNASVHSALPSFQAYEIQRVAFLSLRLLSILQSRKIISEYAHITTKDDKYFLSAFKLDRIDRVKKKIDDAKEKSKRIPAGQASLSVDGWENYVTQCPICESDGMLSGYTDIHVEGSAEDVDLSLDFLADGFICEECGLELNDTEELRLAGIELYYDRSSELDAWHRDQYEPDPSEYL